MTISSQDPLNYQVNTQSPLKRLSQNRAPTQNDHNFELGSEWLDTSSSHWYKLVAINGSVATWVKIGGTGANAETLTGNTGGPVGPDALNNINIIGSATTTVSGNPLTNTLDIITSSGGYPITPYVVGPVGQAGYQTIQAAIDAANADSGGMVYIQPGTYTEDLTLYDEVHIVSSIYEDAQQVVISGSHTPPLSGKISFKGIKLEHASSILLSTDAGSTAFSFEECTFSVTNGYSFDLLNWTGSLNANNCGSTGGDDGFVRNSSSMGVFTNDGQFGAGTANPLIANGDCRFDLTFLDCPVNLSGGNLFGNLVLFSKTLTLSGTVNGNIFLADFFTSNTPALVHNSSGDINLLNSIINSTNNPAIDGSDTGVLSLGGITFVNNENIAATLTLSRLSSYQGRAKVNNIEADYTSGGILLGQGTASDIIATSQPTDGQFLIGSTGSDPVLNTLTAGTGISIVNGPGSSTISSTGPGSVLQYVYDDDSTYLTLTSAIPYDNSIPQIGEGTEVLSATLTPNNANNELLIEVCLFGAITNTGGSASDDVIGAVFQDSGPDAICAQSFRNAIVDSLSMKVRITAGTTNPTTISVRAGPNTGTAYLNGRHNGLGGLFGTAGLSSLTVTEIEV